MRKLFAMALCLVLANLGAMAEGIIPEYDQVNCTPADGATVRSITSVSIEMSREGYDAPIGMMPGAESVIATAYGQNIEGVSARIREGKLVVSFDMPYVEQSVVTIHVPAGITNNLAMPVATMTTEEIIEEGGCTNPAVTLRFNVEPSVLPVKDVTGVGYDTSYKTDADGNFVKDENGQYIRIDKYDSLVDAQLSPEAGDRVTVFYFWYGEKFTSINYKGGASVTNVTSGTPVNIAAVGFKSGGDSHRNDVIELRLSTADYIYSDKYHQGVYEVTLPEGFATTADGRKNGGMTFRFTFGDPEKVYVPEMLDLDAYLGSYETVKEEGEIDPSDETFTLIKDGDAYFVTDLCGSSLRIPVEAEGDKCVLKMTIDDTTDEAFGSMRGGDVDAVFSEIGGEHYVFIDEYALYLADGEARFGGVITFRLARQPIVDSLPVLGATSAAAAGIYDLLGRRTSSASAPRVVIQSGRKAMHK